MKRLFFIIAMSIFCMCLALQAETTRKFGEVGGEGIFNDKDGEGGKDVTAETKSDGKLKKNPVEWKRNMKFATNAERMMKYYQRKKDAKRVRLYKMKVAGFKMRAQAYKIGNMKLYKNSEYLIKGKPIPKPKPAPKKDGEGK